MQLLLALPLPEMAVSDLRVQGLVILLVGLAGGLLPLLTKWNDRKLHNALALSTGIFLGAVFLHMLPALSAAAPEFSGGTASEASAGVHAHGDHGMLFMWSFVLLGVLAVYLLESLVFRTHDHDDLHRHRAVGYASLVGLSVHALTTGVGLAAANAGGDADHAADLAGPVFLAIIAHKAFESFSLMSVFQLAKFPLRRILQLLIAFSLFTPLGVWAGTAMFSTIGPTGLAVALALAAGTFLFVCLTELLPEVFHHKEDIAVKILFLITGIALMAGVHFLES
jgi:zinc transporter ZupT